jgi:pilus assembly protein CpaC
VKKPVQNRLSTSLWLALAAASLGAFSSHAQSPVAPKDATGSKIMTPPPSTATKGASIPLDCGREFSTLGPTLNLVQGNSKLLRLPSRIDRISVGNPNVADINLLSARELYFLGKSFGTTNVIVWLAGGCPTVLDVNVSINAAHISQKLNELMPEEKGIKVTAAASSVILSGEVSSAVKARFAEDIADAYVREANKAVAAGRPAASNVSSATVSSGSSGTSVQAGPSAGPGGSAIPSGTSVQAGPSAGPGGSAINISLGASSTGVGAKVINLLRVAEAQQVMLEVTIAEVSKTLVDKLGASFNASGKNGNWAFGVVSNLLGTGAGVLSAIKNTNGSGFSIDAEKGDGLIKVLAEPNIVAISGQEASFLAGGKVFIPVSRSNDVGGTTITLAEKEFGVGLKFTPTVLEGGRINLKVAPEVSEVSQTGTPFTTVGGQTAVLPSFTTRKVQTTVQLMDGQSLAIAGLIKNNLKEAVNRIPGLGEVPVVGALFRSSEFQGDRSELLFVITPRLVKPLEQNYILPTDGFVPPNRGEFLLGNKLEGTGHPEVPVDLRNAPVPQPGGLEVK